MKASASLELVWQLAGREAIAAQSEEIQPEHFFLALLKFSELPVQIEEHNGVGEDVARELATAVTAVRNVLQARSIDCAETRRKLHEVLGLGNCKHHTEVMHRSPATRQLFDDAMRIADDAISETFAPIHLLQATLANPTDILVPFLGNTPADAPAEPAASAPSAPTDGLLEEFGVDIVQAVSAGQIDVPPENTAQGRALIRALTTPDAKPVILVGQKDQAVRAAILNLARTIHKKRCPTILKNKRIVDITKIDQNSDQNQTPLDLMEKLIDEAAITKDALLLLGCIKDPVSGSTAPDWGHRLKEKLKTTKLCCLCQLSPYDYDRLIEEDRSWRKLTQTIWIVAEQPKDIPTEL